MENLKSILESLLFVSDEPLTVDRLKNILAPVAAADIRCAMAELLDDYENRRGGFMLREVAGGYQFRTRPEHSEWITRLIQPRPPRLSKAALETLAIIAYKQPIIRSDIEHIRGVDCGGVIKVLLERNLIRVLGRKEIPGRPLIYATTKRFLEVFDLKDLKDLPTPKEIDDMGQALADRSEIVIEDDGPTEAKTADDSTGADTDADIPARAGDGQEMLPFPSVADNIDDGEAGQDTVEDDANPR